MTLDEFRRHPAYDYIIRVPREIIEESEEYIQFLIENIKLIQIK